MKVLLIHDYSDDTGGAERIVLATKKILEEAGHSVLMYAPVKHASFVPAVFSIRHYIGVRRDIRRFKPDIMHVHGVYRNISPSVLLAAKHMKVPVLMTMHDFQIVCPKTSLVDENLASCKSGFGYRCFYSSCYPRKPLNRAYQGLKAMKLSLHRFIIRRTVRHYVSPSACLTDWAGKNFGANDVVLLPNFILSDQQPASRIPGSNTVLFVGKLTEQKGVDVLIRAIDKVRHAIPDVRLMVIGDGPEEKKLKELAVDIQVSELVTFKGKLSNFQVMKAYDDAFCVVIPSKYAENCSIVGIEALSKGKVIIASRIGGLPDLVDENKTGFLTEPDDPDDLANKIMYVMQNQSLLPEMGAAARARFEQCFSRQAYYRTLLSVYDRIIHENGNRNAQLR